MPYCKKDDIAEEKLIGMEEKSKSEKFDESYIRELVAMQKGKLSVESKYYKPQNIAEGNWSLVEKDEKIEELDREEIDDDLVDTFISMSKKEPREKNAEYTYVFKSSYYAVKTLILYYLKYRKDAKKIYGLKNAVVRRNSKKSKKFYGGLPFILKYLKKAYKGKLSIDTSIKFDFADIMQKLLDCKSGLEKNGEEDEFINDIIECIKSSHCGDFIVEKRIKDFKDAKEKYFCVKFEEKTEKDGEILNYMIDGYEILMHRDVKKDWKYLEEAYVKEANEKIRKTPKHPFNDSEKDSEKLKKELKGWFSQQIGIKDRLVYKKDKDNKVIYIATVCDHYKDAKGRTKSTVAYK